jgi:hypothetical protein
MPAATDTSAPIMSAAAAVSATASAMRSAPASDIDDACVVAILRGRGVAAIRSRVQPACVETPEHARRWRARRPTWPASLAPLLARGDPPSSSPADALVICAPAHGSERVGDDDAVFEGDAVLERAVHGARPGDLLEPARLFVAQALRKPHRDRALR